jgi:diguanylate cyclase (GGDEF)-like protein/hemerythrin-like metal-binding protein/PAS domain S-box-containing protein
MPTSSTKSRLHLLVATGAVFALSAIALALSVLDTEAFSRGAAPMFGALVTLSAAVALLARRLAKASEAARRAEAELAEHHQHLEQLVEERTAALRSNESRFRFLAENTCDVIWTLDVATQRLTYVSPSVERQRGFTPEEVLEAPLGASMTPESETRMRDVLEGTVERWLAGEREDTMRVTEVDQPHKDGRVIHTEMVTSLHADESGQPQFIIGVTRDVTQRKRTEDAIRHLAFHDALTQLPNRRLFLDRLQQAMARARRERTKMALLFIDLDEFKPINDEMGHEMGDWLLQAAAQRMLECLRAYDTAARFGGDEFVILLPDIAKAEESLYVAERIRSALSEPFETGDGRRLQISSSIGIALFPDHADDERELLRVGDEAMYRAKNEGRDRIELIAPENLPWRVTSRPPPFAPHLAWSSDFACGNAAIDSEHLQLFQSMNQLFSKSLLAEREPAAFREDLAQLLAAIAAHFEHEESILRAWGYVRLEEHREEHRALLDRMDDLNRRSKLGEVTLGEVVDFIATELIARHMMQADRDFFPFVVGGEIASDGAPRVDV